MMQLAIERNVPVPPRGDGIRDVLRAMEVGDSVLFPGRTAHQMRHYIAGVRAGKYFETRTLTTGARVWRLE